MPTGNLNIELNGYGYQLYSHLRPCPQEVFPGKVNIGNDDYAKQTNLSYWTRDDTRDGGGVLEMDITKHLNRHWWTNCNVSKPKHMTLPRKATAITSFTAKIVTPTFTTATSGSGGANWTGTTWNPPGVAPLTTSDYTYRWGGFWAGRFRITPTITGTFTTMNVDIYDGVTWVNKYSATPTYGSPVTIDFTDQFVVSVRVNFLMTVGGTVTVATGQLETAQGAAPTGTMPYSANFNDKLYFAIGDQLCRMVTGRASFVSVGVFPANITALVASVDNKLYIFCGDTFPYSYMTTGESITMTDVAGGTKAVQWGNVLWKLKADGTFAYCASPGVVSPSWTAGGAITDLASQIQTLTTGRDATGALQMYCATKSVLLIYDDVTDVWVHTECVLPSHPNGGKGFTYWNGNLYDSYGLSVKQYSPGSTAPINEVGLDNDDGLPAEYNGEIVKFCGDNPRGLLALVDASQVTGTSQSTLYEYNGRGWTCLWADSANDSAMYDVIVSPGDSCYAIYWSCASSIIYMDIPRGNENINVSASSTKYESYTSGNDLAASVLGANWWAQIITPALSHTVTHLRLPLYRIGTPGTLTVSFKAVDGSSKPTGADLCTGTFNANDCTVDTSGLYYLISLGAGTALTAGTKYAIVARATAASPNAVKWWMDNTSGAYTGGNILYSGDSGSTWTATATSDFLFEEWNTTPSNGGFEASGIYLSPIFNGGSAVMRTLIKNFLTDTRNITTTETVTIKYRTNRVFMDRDSGWTTLVTLDTMAENGILEQLFGGGQGELVSSFQYRIDLARGSDTTLSPDTNAMELGYLLGTGSSLVKAWLLPIQILKGSYGGKSDIEQYNNLWDAIESGLLVPLCFRRDTTNETHYVKLTVRDSWEETGDYFTGQITLLAVEI